MSKYEGSSKYDSKKIYKPVKDDFIFGVRSVIEAIKAGRAMNKILIQKGMDKDLFLELKEALKAENHQLQFVPSEKLESITDQNHQGVIALVSPIEYYKIEDVVEDLIEADKKPFILALDRVTDVRNFGAIARTAECEGVDAILIPSKGSAQVTADAIKTSAGALNRIKVCKTDSLKDSLFYVQQCGLRIVACTEKSSIPLYQANLRGAVAVILGSEQDGITSDLINLADVSCKIPMRGEIASLNVSVAAGMVLYEKLRQEIL
ncbi:MAG: 23S rRNA (guanosine(2251)-2'-O)-methyltransferase RlmB [Crocinitomicaceae bacterium]|nr:23S rRNA (guanosine(2251)-2'-O)-methyltransferase RlmB [Crocinitomicaceae bacterium]